MAKSENLLSRTLDQLIEEAWALPPGHLPPLLEYFQYQDNISYPQFLPLPPSGSPSRDGLHVMTQQVTPSEDLLNAIMDKLYGDHCAKAVVRCQHCGQWAARFCTCQKCGAPVD